MVNDVTALSQRLHESSVTVAVFSKFISVLSVVAVPEQPNNRILTHK